MKYLIIIIILIILFIIFNKSYNYEHFCGVDTLLTVDPVNFVSADTINNALRHIVLSNASGIMYISNRKPTNLQYKLIKCPHHYTKLDTLGDNNYCWKKNKNIIIV